MKLVIFAGGHGTRLWPLSRKNSPKQFEKLFNGKSTLQLAIDRVQDIFGVENIYISTNEKFADLIKEQLPILPKENIFLEPAKRDLAAAVGLSFMKIHQTGYSGPIAILWADHLMDRVEEFTKALTTGEELIIENPNRFVFLGEHPRFANHNLGWITVGDKINEKNGLPVYEFKSWKYRPELEQCKQMFESGKSFWNPGYFVTSVEFVLGLYREFMPEMHRALKDMVKDPEDISSKYPTLESISFDNAILEKVSPSQAVVLKINMGWSDPGTLYALKEALEESPESNVTKGKTFTLETKDTLVINHEENKLVTTVGLEGMVVINTEDAVIVVHKDDVPKVKVLVDKLKEEGLEEYI